MNRSIALTLLATVPIAGVLAHGTGALGAHNLDWHDDDVSRVVAPSISFGNFGLIRFAVQPPRVLEVDGRRCMAAGILLLDVADALIFDADETVALALTLDASTSASSLTVAYDRNGGPGLVEVELPASPDGGLHVQQLTLDRARFAGRGDFGTDVMIVAQPGVTVCAVEVSPAFTTPEPQAHGWLELSVRDEHGDPTPARLGLYDATGRTPLPSADAVAIEEFDDRTRLALLTVEPGTASWPSANRWVFYTDGAYRARLPAGDYELVVSRGPEYRTSRRALTIRAGATQRPAVDLQRWADLPARGWYSGDVHVHRARRDDADDESTLIQARAEDVHVVSSLRMGNLAALHYPQRRWGPAGRHGYRHHTVVPGQEDPRTSLRGHTLHLDLPEPVREPSRYLLYHEVFERVAALGGISGYGHVGSRGGPIGADVGLALEAPFELVDFVEVLQAGHLGTALWFDFLNLGYRIAPAAGSDYPYLGRPGSVRGYVKLDDGYSPDAWFDNLAAGKTFVTNGPVLELEINGADMGAQLELAAGDVITVAAIASINPDIDLLERLELIEQGEVVAESTSVDGRETLELAYEARAEHGTWFVVRASGRTRTVNPDLGEDAVQAVSAPVYVSVDGQRTWKRSAVATLARERIALLDALSEAGITPTSGVEYWQDGGAMMQSGPDQLALLRERIDEARDRYRALIDAAR